MRQQSLIIGGALHKIAARACTRNPPGGTTPVARAHSMAAANDWSAKQYLKFNRERTRPSRDLVAQIPLSNPKRVVDLGCGPGNSTEVLAEHYPNAILSAIDSSPDMIAKAKAAYPHIDFAIHDLKTYVPSEPIDPFFCNAVFQWIPSPERGQIITKLLQGQPSGAVFAFQVPNNFTEPSHEAMRVVAAREPYAAAISAQKPTREDFETPHQLYDLLAPLCSEVNIWQTDYQHVMENHEAIVEWLKGTGLMPYVNPLSPEQKDGFLKEYLDLVKTNYPASYDGKVLFRFPRLFVMAVRK